MFNLDEEKIECALGNKEFCFWQGKKAENVVFLFLTSGLAAVICLWLLIQIQTTRLIMLKKWGKPQENVLLVSFFVSLVAW